MTDAICKHGNAISLKPSYNFIRCVKCDAEADADKPTPPAPGPSTAPGEIEARVHEIVRIIDNRAAYYIDHAGRGSPIKMENAAEVAQTILRELDRLRQPVSPTSAVPSISKDDPSYISRLANEARSLSDRGLAAIYHDYPIVVEFHRKYAMGSKMKPSCLVCGKPNPFVITHAELPDIGVCENCRPTSAGADDADVKEFADDAVQWLCELPDRTSPDDWPEACLVEGEELHEYLMEQLPELLRKLRALTPPEDKT